MQSDAPQIRLSLPNKATFLLTEQARFKCLYGGRGGAKSRSAATALIISACQKKELILCTREYQNSISDSVHRTLVSAIDELNLRSYFDVQAKTIIHRSTGSEFIYKGLQHDIQGIKSTEGITKCWVEEAQSVSAESWQTLIPTIRTPKSEIWVTFNPYLESDPTSQRFIENPDKRAIIKKIGWQDNAWFPEELESDRLADLARGPDAYQWIWEGDYLKVSEATIFRGNYEICTFDSPIQPDRFFFGADFGFANDPNTLVRMFIEDDCLFIDYEAYGRHVEIDDIPTFYEGGLSIKTQRIYAGVPECYNWPIYADSARPETISYLANRGFHISAADKWPGCVEDGIAHLKGFKKIYIHERCPRTAEEFRLYSFKVDQKTGDALPIVVDRHNHCIDGIRYGLNGYVQKRGGTGVWAALARNRR